VIVPTGDTDEECHDEEDDQKTPELHLDDDGYATLPSRDDVNLKGQQELVRKIFGASYSEWVSGIILHGVKQDCRSFHPQS
jgi:hypothetical protein